MSSNKPTGAEIRQDFIDFFIEHKHTFVPSSSLVPGGDATLLFTNAGMVQFKDVFVGTDKRPYTRAANSQKCMRVAGKHNDLEDVGRDDTHHTFFEMLGNWSFGDYYKKEAIEWAWQLLTNVWGLPKDKLWATVFKDDVGDVPTDEEAADYWKQQDGMTPERVLYFGREDNFWEMAETGPCGPCSEIHLDRGDKYCNMKDVDGHLCGVNGECTRFLELWNLVFIQYNRLGPTHLEPLPATHVDTGMGFERIVSVLQDVDSNYKTDLFEKPLAVLRELTGHSEKEMLKDFTPYRVICDHARTAAFLIADGVVPGNMSRNYVCRMIIRRAARFGSMIDLNEPFMAKVADTVIATYGDFFPELEKNKEAIFDNLTREETRFARTVETGTAHLQNLLDKLDSAKNHTLGGKSAFDLYATYGLPFEITRDIAQEQDLEVDEAGFRAAMDEHRLKSGGGRAMGSLEGEEAEFFSGVLKSLQADKKLGADGVEYEPYDSTAVEGELLALTANGEALDTASAGDRVSVIVPKTGFYIESGGQVSDTGYIRAADGSWEIEVQKMRKPSAGVIVHEGEVILGHPKVGDKALVEVELQRRHDIMRNHTATHLMHKALRDVLGESARQAGSLVAPDRLRFDFNHPDAMTTEQIDRVEKIVNDAVAADMAVQPKFKSQEEAIKEGAVALFGEKYGETVRTLTIFTDDEESEKYSYELCGGTHLERTSDVGAFLITSEGSAAAGVRRIEAITGRGAYDLIARRFKILKQAARTLKSSVDDIPQKIDNLQGEIAKLKKQVTDLRKRQALDDFSVEFNNVLVVKDVNYLVAEVPYADAETLRSLADTFRERYPNNGAVVIVSGKNVISAITKDLEKRGLKAGDLITAIGGRGGGRPNLAQGSLPNELKLDDALKQVSAELDGKLK